MKNLGWWALFALALSLGAAGGCGGNAPEKVANQGGAKPAANVDPAAKQAANESTEGPASADMPATDVPETKVEVVDTNDQVPAKVGTENSAPAEASDGQTSQLTKPIPKKVAETAPSAVRVAGPDPIPEKIDPAVQKRVLALSEALKAVAPKKDAGGLGKNDFKQIALAFHNYHDVIGHVPSLTGNGSKDETQPGLSWRVYLLPYLDQAPLYNEFHLDEPWDSEHNKALITQMPKVFGSNEEGKTRVHVLTGNDAPFKSDMGWSFREITDGTSNTILSVESGADKADFWTKPGGLEFDPKDPLKCMGNVDDTFLVGLIDGSVRTVAKTIKPETLAILIQKSDGHPLPPDAFEATPVAVAPKIKVVEPVTPLAPATPRMDLSYIPEEAFSAVVLHPRRVYSHPIVKGIRDLAPPGMFAPGSGMVPFDAQMGMTQIAEFSSWMGIAPENLDEVVILLDRSFPEAAVAGFVEGGPQFGVIIRNSAPIDVEGALTSLGKVIPGVDAEDFEGVTLLSSPDRNGCIAFITDSMFIVGQFDFVKKMILAREQVASTSVLTKRLEALGNQLFVLAVDGQPLGDAVAQVAGQIPPPVSLFSPYFTGAKELNLAFDLDAPVMLQINVQFKNEQLATGLHAILDQNWSWAKEQYTDAKKFISAEPGMAALLPYTDQFISESQLSKVGELITFTVPRLHDLDQLPERLKPAFEQANKAAEKTKQLNNQKNSLKQIGLAFHNYHDAFKMFPALNGPGPKDMPHPGLSWRVYLLPFLDEAPLYNQFKLDEPWDSEHNKSLIARMPKVFGTNKDGKTTIHLFTGKGAPFQNDAGTGIQSIRDGTSNTFLAVEAGEDVAEIWTKPGGLEFDPENPLKCLGEIKEFLVVMMDGSVRRVKDIKAETFSRLVQHADSQVIDDF